MARRSPAVEPALEPHERIAQAYRNAFTTESGRLVLDDLRKAFARRTSHVPNDPYTTAYREGQRDVYLRIMAFIDPEQIDQEELL